MEDIKVVIVEVDLGDYIDVSGKEEIEIDHRDAAEKQKSDVVEDIRQYAQDKEKGWFDGQKILKAPEEETEEESDLIVENLPLL